MNRIALSLQEHDTNMPATSARHRVMVDRTHMGRRRSGIERITDELFSPQALAPVQVGTAKASGSRAAMILRQRLLNPAAAVRDPTVPWIFPGYPPSPLFARWRERTVLYVHDLFLLSRPQDLNWSAKLYMVSAFRAAIGRLRYFLVNSATTAAHLSQHVRDDANLLLYRPRVSNVFRVRPWPQRSCDRGARPLVVGAVGTIEPRKNFPTAARICDVLSRMIGRPVELHIIGRSGWGPDFAALSRLDHVRLHGFLNEDDARTVIEGFDLFLCTSHDEGLGLPLLEAQYAGLPVIAPDQQVFWEVLGTSGTYIDVQNPEQAAAAIAGLLQNPDWRARAATRAEVNLARWNAQADHDRHNVVGFLMGLSERVAPTYGAASPVRAR
jgi:glycosyltransferase involved in cell wall biosynthesis